MKHPISTRARRLGRMIRRLQKKRRRAAGRWVMITPTGGPTWSKFATEVGELPELLRRLTGYAPNQSLPQ